MSAQPDLELVAGVECFDRPEQEVSQTLDRGRGGPLASLSNVVLVLENDTRWKGRIQQSLFDSAFMIDGAPVEDIDESKLALWLDRTYQLRVQPQRIHDALRLVADANPVHPVRDWLESLEWDGEPRLDSFLHRYTGAQPSPINATVGRCWLVGAVARVFEPGCKMDNTLVLLGPQGTGKSQVCEALVPRETWFSDTVFDLSNKDGYRALEGVWIYELAELAAIKRSSILISKAFLSSRVDRYRRHYDRNLSRVKRQCVLLGTTNDAEFLADPTGSRRFWPVRTGILDPDGVRRDRDQIWAEALVAYRKEHLWWLNAQQKNALAEIAQIYTSSDPWTEAIASWAEAQVAPFTTLQVLVDAVGLEVGRLKRADENRVGTVLRSLEYEKTRVREGGRRVYLWGREGA